MKNLNQIKTAADTSAEYEAALVSCHLASLEDNGDSDDAIRESLDRLAKWATSFRDSIGVAG